MPDTHFLDYALSFPDESAAHTVLLAAHVLLQHEGGMSARENFAVDIIGVVYKRYALADGEIAPASAQVETSERDGTRYAVFPPTPYLVNVRAKEAVTDAAFLAAVIPAPQYPLRVWA